MTVFGFTEPHTCVHRASCVLPATSLQIFSPRPVRRPQAINNIRPAATAAPISTEGDLQQAESSTTDDHASSASSVQPSMSPSELRSLWDRIGKPLLRIGKGGLQMTHINSMRELLYSHTLIKVQINQHDQNQVTDTCQQLASQSHAQLLQLKGRTALFMQAHADVDILMQSPSWQGSSQGHRASQHQLERTWHNADEAEEVQLQAGVQSQLQFLTSAGILMADELDKRGLRSLSQLPEGPALTLLKGMSKTSMRGVRNKSAWLNSQCKRITAQNR